MKSVLKKLSAGTTAAFVKNFFLSVLFVTILIATLYMLITSPA